MRPKPMDLQTLISNNLSNLEAEEDEDMIGRLRDTPSVVGYCLYLQPLCIHTPSTGDFIKRKNGIQTSKYNLITFIPKNLSEQFLRLANFYFLTLVILQLCPVISPLNPLTTMFPLTLVITLTAVKDAVDDYRRHKNDKEVNNRKVSILRNQGLIDEKWHNVQVGDVIKIESNRPIAADLLLISSSEPYGLCYVETAELDGETNLKCRQSLNDTFNMTQNLKKLGAFDGEIICEPPNDRLNVFEGKLLWREKTFPLDNEKILLRGCTVRNTKWCFGVVIFAGKDTKLMMNSGKTFFKRTSLDRYLNNLIVGIVIFLVAMSSTCSIMLGIWEQGDGQKFRLLLPMSRTIRRTCASSERCQAIISSMLTFLSYIILMNTVVPISLYVSYLVQLIDLKTKSHLKIDYF
uniref:P-type ATPase N-terminal domain-containing protein n=1 Tax=Romanomermis culicivorax TaxID=13658 RepID=A0A915IDM9_ROMCU